MFDTECKGCGHAKRLGFFLYCKLNGYRPAKRRCEHYWRPAAQTRLNFDPEDNKRHHWHDWRGMGEKEPRGGKQDGSD